MSKVTYDMFLLFFLYFSKVSMSRLRYVTEPKDKSAFR